MTMGVVELDAHHKYLIDFINDLGHSIQKRYDSDVISKVLKVMKYYAEWQFHKDEECMLRYHCPVAEDNHKAHIRFMDKFHEFQKEFEASGGSIELSVKIHEELSNWIISHIMAIDTQLAPCVH